MSRQGENGGGFSRGPLQQVLVRLRSQRSKQHATLIVPSHELEQNESLEARFQDTENTSRLCSCQDCTGKSSRPVSKSLIEPSPVATRTWFSCVSDHARSKRESCVSKLLRGLESKAKMESYGSSIPFLGCNALGCEVQNE